MDSIPLKRCPTCPEDDCWHPATLEYFYKRGDGLRGTCKSCSKKAVKDWQQTHPEKKRAKEKAYYSTHRKEVAERGKIYRQKHTEQIQVHKRTYHQTHAEQIASYNKKYRHEHLEEIKARWGRYYEEEGEKLRNYQKVYRRENEEVVRERWDAWEKANSEKVRISNIINQQKRRAREKQIQGSFTGIQVHEMLKRHHYHCYFCGNKLQEDSSRVYGYSFHIEHTYPLSRVVGMDIPANDMSYLVPSCPTCNKKKGSKFPWEFPEGGRLL